jgi:hypothetical protein
MDCLDVAAATALLLPLCFLKVFLKRRLFHEAGRRHSGFGETLRKGGDASFITAFILYYVSYTMTR